MSILKLSASFFIALALASVSPQASARPSPPAAPVDPSHPGSLNYPYSVRVTTLRCGDRDVTVYLPTASSTGETFAAVIYGHGQALGVGSYDATLRHLAGKGVAAIFPTYDNGFFDQDWSRMGADFVRLTDCALSKFPEVDKKRLIYSGHSKGAYIASIASGLVGRLSPGAAPQVLMVFETAGLDLNSLRDVDPNLALTVVFGDSDTTVEQSFSRDLYQKSPSLKKQFITVASYRQTSPSLEANHMWPLTKRSIVGGQDPNSLHYYGEWKWLTAAAQDLGSKAPFTNRFIYGDEATDKGDLQTRDQIERSW